MEQATHVKIRRFGIWPHSGPMRRGRLLHARTTGQTSLRLSLLVPAAAGTARSGERGLGRGNGGEGALLDHNAEARERRERQKLLALRAPPAAKPVGHPRARGAPRAHAGDRRRRTLRRPRQQQKQYRHGHVCGRAAWQCVPWQRLEVRERSAAAEARNTAASDCSPAVLVAMALWRRQGVTFPRARPAPLSGPAPRAA